MTTDDLLDELQYGPESVVPTAKLSLLKQIVLMRSQELLLTEKE